MAEEEKKNELELIEVNTEELNKESLAIINQIITEQDAEKTKDLTYLFNVNQNKKTMVRANKLNELLDVLTDAAVDRFTQRPDEISNQELMQGLKIVQDLIERSQKQVNGVNEQQPLIQINQQNNTLEVGGTKGGLNRDSRERVKNAVLDLLNGITTQTEEAEVEDVVVNPAPAEVEGNEDDD